MGFLHGNLKDLGLMSEKYSWMRDVSAMSIDKQVRLVERALEWDSEGSLSG